MKRAIRVRLGSQTKQQHPNPQRIHVHLCHPLVYMCYSPAPSQPATHSLSLSVSLASAQYFHTFHQK